MGHNMNRTLWAWEREGWVAHALGKGWMGLKVRVKRVAWLSWYRDARGSQSARGSSWNGGSRHSKNACIHLAIPSFAGSGQFFES